MKNKFYSATIFILILTLLVGIIQSVTYLLMNGENFRAEAFLWWFILTNTISLSSSIFLIKYYHVQQYGFSFLTAILSTITNTFFVIIFYLVLIERQLQQFYFPSLFLVLATGLAYGSSLVFSRAKEKFWLKIAGMSIMVLGLLVIALLLVASFYSAQLGGTTIGEIDQWLGLIGNSPTLFFILHFRSEAKIKNDDNQIYMSATTQDLLTYGALVGSMLTLIVGGWMIKECYHTLQWTKANASMAEVLVTKSESYIFANNQGDTLKYLLMKPKDFDPQKKYPLVVCLPAGGYESPLAELLSSESNRSRYPCFLFIPYCDQDSGWGGRPALPARDQVVYDAINALEPESIDRKRQYVSGISRGGYGSWHFITTHPEMFAAAIPVCAGGDTSLASKIAGVPVWAFHGTKDKHVPVSESRNMIEAIKKAGGDPKYTEFPDKAHGIWYEVSTTPGLLNWLFEQSR